MNDEVAPEGLAGLEVLPGRISDASFAALVDRCAAVEQTDEPVDAD